MESKLQKTSGITFKEKLGYALGDTGGILTFSLIGAFQNFFYTNTLGISPAKIITLIFIARIWDAVNDPMWGAFIDSRKPTKQGRFRPYIFGFSIPLAVSAVMMFTVIPGLSEAKYLLFSYITYIAYGMFYTAVNIPYGSLASVITDDEKERSSLSMWRSIGAGIGGLPGTIILPLIVYDTIDKENDIKALNSTRFTVCVAVLAAISVLVYYLHFKWTKERIIPTKKEKGDFSAIQTVKDLLKSRPFVTVSITSMLLVTFQFYYQSTYPYLFNDYFKKPELYAVVTICTYIPMGIFIPIMNKLIGKIGKKELCTAGLIFAAVTNLALYFIQPENPIVFLVFVFFSGMGQTFLVLEIWALVMDVIDYHEYKTGRREEGTAYALFSFMRKLGQTLAGVGLNALLAFINYNADDIKNSISTTGETLDKLYDISTLVPAIVLSFMALSLGFGYNLSKKKLSEMRNALELNRNKEKEI